MFKNHDTLYTKHTMFNNHDTLYTKPTMFHHRDTLYTKVKMFKNHDIFFFQIKWSNVVRLNLNVSIKHQIFSSVKLNSAQAFTTEVSIFYTIM